MVLISIEYFVSTCPRVQPERDAPAGLFRRISADSWLSAHYVEDGRWRLSTTLPHELTSGGIRLRRVSSSEAMAALAALGGRPDSFDRRAGAAAKAPPARRAPTRL
jgi:hypothetical protein